MTMAFSVACVAHEDPESAACHRCRGGGNRTDTWSCRHAIKCGTAISFHTCLCAARLRAALLRPRGPSRIRCRGRMGHIPPRCRRPSISSWSHGHSRQGSLGRPPASLCSVKLHACWRSCTTRHRITIGVSRKSRRPTKQPSSRNPSWLSGCPRACASRPLRSAASRARSILVACDR